MTGSAMFWPITSVVRSRSEGWPATWGAKPSSPNAARLSSYVVPRSEPASSAAYTDGGSRRLARRCASATVSSQPPLIEAADYWQSGGARCRQEKHVYAVPRHIDEEIAAVKLTTLGVEIDALSPGQLRYLASWDKGT